jgi:hypothetical protein
MLRIAADPRGTGSMKKANKVVPDPDMRAEYDFARMEGGVRGKYAGWFAGQQKGRIVAVLLAPDVAPFFPSSESVNAALRAAIAATDRAAALARRRGPTKAGRPVRG